MVTRSRSRQIAINHLVREEPLFGAFSSIYYVLLSGSRFVRAQEMVFQQTNNNVRLMKCFV